MKIIISIVLAILLTTVSFSSFAVPVNINNADSELIADSLAGIGVKTAEKIVVYRKKNGAFKKVDDLLLIKGIGDKNPAMRGYSERQAINAPIQGSAADVIRRAMIRMEGELRRAKLDAKMLLQVHDELIFETPKAQADDTCAVVKRVMEGAHKPAVSISVPLDVEASAGQNWDEAH